MTLPWPQAVRKDGLSVSIGYQPRAQEKTVLERSQNPLFPEAKHQISSFPPRVPWVKILKILKKKDWKICVQSGHTNKQTELHLCINANIDFIAYLQTLDVQLHL